jgi:hypothetical protein
MRAALEAELKRVTVDELLIESTVSLVNLAGRRAGLVPGAEDERDLGQVEAAIDAVQGLLAVLERRGRQEVRPLRDALAQLQLAYARERTGAPAGAPPEGATPEAEDPGPAQRSGRLWVPGQD